MQIIQCKKNDINTLNKRSEVLNIHRHGRLPNRTKKIEYSVKSVLTPLHTVKV